MDSTKATGFSVWQFLCPNAQLTAPPNQAKSNTDLKEQQKNEFSNLSTDSRSQLAPTSSSLSKDPAAHRTARSLRLKSLGFLDTRSMGNKKSVLWILI